ncbi:metal ABC transporter ATP-binding protein [Aeromicrobium terrae]|uniref:Metal ABC transporter ATP-binding protein n=1 Tax=Aeromicrobium terrae TaxID=2498846 RepID=A0A5C8NIX4_9ACTN|nr:metal ABC transporter ATP-binding protein [Aeromicrobium terrae]TXL61172.1 metal ABC transporter ATP-binding protein [Aeromicrobium terrae]
MTQPTSSDQPVLRVTGATVTLDGRRVLTGVDLDVAPGEFVTLLGANGSGKSTLVRAAVGLVPLDSGSVELFGTPLARFRDRRRIGYVPQRSRAVAGVPATVHEVVMSGRLPRRPYLGFGGRADREAVEAAVDRVGLGDRLRSSLADLSGGQQQRVLIARALVTGADLLVMDEPTAGVDHRHQESLAELLGDLSRDGVSVLLVAHELGPMRVLIDRAVVLHDGVVRYDGPVSGVTGEEHEHVHHHATRETRIDVPGAEGVW